MLKNKVFLIKKGFCKYQLRNYQINRKVNRKDINKTLKI